MQKKNCIQLFILSCLFLTTPSHAETLLELYNLAELNDPSLKAVNAERLAVLEKQPQARALLRPQLVVGATAAETWQTEHWPLGGNEVENTNLGYSVGIDHPLYRRDRNIAVTQAEIQIQEMTARYESERQALMEKVATRYFDVLAAHDSIKFNQGAKEAFKRQWDQAQQRFEVGLIAITDVQEAKAGYDLAVADEIQSKNQLDNTREALREITGHYHEGLATLQEEIPLIVPEPADVHVWTTIALENNPLIIATQHTLAQAQQEIERQRAALLPTVDLVGRHQYTDVIRGEETFGGVDNRLSVQLNYSLYEGGARRSRIREAQQRYTQVQYQLEQQRRTIQSRTHSTYLNVLSGISRVKALKQALMSTTTALEAVQTGFEVGTRTSIDVVNAQRDLLSAQRNLSTARYDYLVNKLRLRQAAGIITAEDLGGIGQLLMSGKKN
jgi:outer membrane protein